MRKIILFFGVVSIFVLFSSETISAQNESNIWYFGENAGLDFSTGKPATITNGMVNTTEGVATICNSKGELLFYTDGITVLNKNHQVMENGSSLLGNPSSTQSAVAVLKPGTTDIYYLFTIAASAGEDGFRYSIVDMKANNGLGAITEKNVLLATPSTERITAVKHQNNKDIWIITHGWESNEFSAYLLTETGLSKQDVKTNIGVKHGGDDDNSIGYMKASADGSQLAVAIKGSDIVEIFDFDNATGKISNPIHLTFSEGSLVYGIEFSTNGSFLYVGSGGEKRIYQFNLLAGSNDAIAKSGIIIGNTDTWTGALQIARDGKIYVSPFTSVTLDVINNPNELGSACNFQKGAVDLGGKSATLGFPSFIQSYFVQKEFKNEVQLFSNTTELEKGKSFILSNIYFDTDKYELKSTSFTELNILVDLLKKNPNISITVSGHTDNVGNKSYNLKLSENRAQAITAYLISKGIDAKRITTIGYGSGKPIASNETEDGRKQNRRVEFLINQ